MKKILFSLFLLIFLLPPNFVYAQEAVIIGQITDEHIEPETPLNFSRLKEVLYKIKALSPDLLISTGDHTTYNDAPSYNQFNQAFSQVGGFIKFPSLIPSSNGIAFIPIAGNHDGWNNNPYDDYKTIRSFVIGNYRFVGLSNNLRYDFPQTEIENELKKSCIDGKPIIFFHHYCPQNWISDPSLDIGEQAWNRLDNLLQGYPVIAYLAGHNHYGRTEAFSPGYVAHTGGRTGSGYLTVAGLSNKRINLFYSLNSNLPLVITEPSQYYPGLNYTKTPQKIIKVKAYAKENTGTISQIYFQIDEGNSVPIFRIGNSNYYEGTLDASQLSGKHTLTVTAKNSLGSWANGIQKMDVYFDNNIPEREAPLCGNLPSATPTPSPSPTPSPTPTPPSSGSCSVVGNSVLDQEQVKNWISNQITTNWGYGGPLIFTPNNLGKADRIELYASGNGEIEAKIIDENNNNLTEIVRKKVSSKGWLSFDFTTGPILTPKVNYQITFRAVSGTVYLWRGNYWAWAYRLYLKPCIN